MALAVLLTTSSLSLTAGASPGETIKGEPETITLASETIWERATDFNKGWKFNLGDISNGAATTLNDATWSSVDLPHDFSISQNFTTSGEAESGFLPGGTGWYRKSFTLPQSAAGKTIILNFDGVYNDAYVYVNGKLVGQNHYGYNNFAIDVTDYMICDGASANLVAVKAVNQLPSSRWYSGSGIYRDVQLMILDPLHVAHNGISIKTPNIQSGDGTTAVTVELENKASSAVTATVRTRVYEKGGAASLAEATKQVTVSAKSTTAVNLSLTVNAPKLWSTDAPNLYTAVTEILVDGTVKDTVSNEFGYRWYAFTSGTGFSLNGEKLKLNGVCLHHDQGALGAAAAYDAMYRQLSIMKDMGVNAVRTAHNPADEDFIAICNELGLLVIEELFDGWVDAKNGNSNDFSRYFNSTMGNAGLIGSSASMTWAEFVARSIVRRDRTAPSIILWSLGNEIQEGTYWTNASSYATYAANLIDWIDAEDGTRPCTSGDNNRGGDSSLVAVLNTIRNKGGVIGFNYANSASTLRSLAQKYGGVIIASETSSATNSRGRYMSQANNSNIDSDYHLTSYDTSRVGWGITAHESLYNTYITDSVAGEFVWTGFDYIGEPTPWNGTGTGSVSNSGARPNSSYFGIVETTGFPKDSYYLYRSQWNKQADTLHLVTAWDSDNYMTTDGKTPVWIYSNAYKVELYRNNVLVGTAQRVTNRTAAGYEYYTYTTQSNNTGICTPVSGSGSTALYAVFNVTYAAGTISARAYDEYGNEITSRCAGNVSVSTPGTVSKLVVEANKTQLTADGSSLAYVTVDVTDANGVLDTTASNKISFTLSGPGVIVGVDNGNQSSTSKYQQSSVLTSAASANINAYAGKALVIIRSTDVAGTISLNVAASGLTGGSVSFTTEKPEEKPVAEGLASYTMVRDYTVGKGTVPELETTASGLLTTGQSVQGTIAWDPVSETAYSTAGTHVLNGVLTIAGRQLAVTARLHVIDDVVALRNVALMTTAGILPQLPASVSGVLADGTLSGEFLVSWDAITETMFQNVGETVAVNGSASIGGITVLPVIGYVRVAESIIEEEANVALQAHVSEEVPGESSDNINSVNDGITNPSDSEKTRWTNYKSSTIGDTASVIYTWDTNQRMGSVHLYFRVDNYSAALPAAVSFAVSQNPASGEFTPITATAEALETFTYGQHYKYTFDTPADALGLKITLQQQGGTTGGKCVGLTEAQVMSYTASAELLDTADLADIKVDGVSLNGFAASVLSYTAAGTSVSAVPQPGVAATVLPIYNNVVRILTISETGTTQRCYAVTLEENHVCAHVNTTLVGAKPATCIEQGYTGDLVCSACGEVQQKGSAVEKLAHRWNAGIVTKPAASGVAGERTYTCYDCGTERTEEIPALPLEKLAPSASVTAKRGSSSKKITLTGIFDDFENKDNYYEVTSHGLIYYSTVKLGTKQLTVNTPGRTRVTFSGYNSDGSFIYTMTASAVSTKYTVRAFLCYTDSSGISRYVYSNPIVVSYNTLP